MARPKPRYTHWTADTKTAFLMALRATGSVTAACAAIGRSLASPYGIRKRDPAFAAQWRAVLDEWEREAVVARRAAAGVDDARAMPNRARFDGFTPLRQRAFLRALSESGDVRAACRTVQVSNNAAYRLREKYPSFAAAWDRALAQSVATLEQAAFERAVEGIEEAVWHAGKLVGTRRRFSDALLGRMLAREDKKLPGVAGAGAGGRAGDPAAAAKAAAQTAGGYFETAPGIEAVEARLERQLDALARRQERERAEAVARDWADWRRAWRAMGAGRPAARTPAQEVLPPLPDPHDGARLRLV